MWIIHWRHAAAAASAKSPVHMWSRLFVLISKPSSPEGSEGELTWEGKIILQAFKKIIPCEVFSTRFFTLSLKASTEQRACVQALNCSTWTFTPAWSQRSLKVENGTGPEFPLFARPTSGSQRFTQAEEDQWTPGPSGEDARSWQPAARQSKHLFVSLTAFVFRTENTNTYFEGLSMSQRKSLLHTGAFSCVFFLMWGRKTELWFCLSALQLTLCTRT